MSPPFLCLCHHDLRREPGNTFWCVCFKCSLNYYCKISWIKVHSQTYFLWCHRTSVSYGWRPLNSKHFFLMPFGANVCAEFMSKINLQMRQMWPSAAPRSSRWKKHISKVRQVNRSLQKNTIHSSRFIRDDLNFNFWKTTKRWLSREAVLASLWKGVYHQSIAPVGVKSLCFLRVWTLFVLARCTETICHYVSECKTCAPLHCNVPLV